MENTNSVDLILDFLRQNRFTRAEAALRSELTNRLDVSCILQKLTLKEESGNAVGQSGDKTVVQDQESGSSNIGEVSKELIVKEIQCGTGRNGAERKWKNYASTGVQNKPNEVAGSSDRYFNLSKGSEETVLDLYSWKFNPSNGTVNSCQSEGISEPSNLLEIKTSQQSNEVSFDIGKGVMNTGKNGTFADEKKTSWLVNTSKNNVDPEYDRMQVTEPKDLEQQQFKSSNVYPKENFTDKLWSRGEGSASSSSELWKNCSFKTVIPFSMGEVATTYDNISGSDKKEGKKKTDANDIRAAIKEQVDDLGRALYLAKSEETFEQKTISSLVFPLTSQNHKEEFPRLPPVKLKKEDKPFNTWEEKFERDGPAAKFNNADNTRLIGYNLDVPIGQEINSSG